MCYYNFIFYILINARGIESVKGQVRLPLEYLLLKRHISLVWKYQKIQGFFFILMNYSAASCEVSNEAPQPSVPCRFAGTMKPLPLRGNIKMFPPMGAREDVTHQFFLPSSGEGCPKDTGSPLVRSTCGVGVAPTYAMHRLGTPEGGFCFKLPLLFS
jgi:hypothetical protein